MIRFSNFETVNYGICFSRIINGEIPSYKVAENDKYYAFLDIAPLQKGHTLVVPKGKKIICSI